MLENTDLVDYGLVLAGAEKELEILRTEVRDADRLELALILQSLELLPCLKERTLNVNESWKRVKLWMTCMKQDAYGYGSKEGREQSLSSSSSLR
jgi:hypothetical protein